MQKEQEQNSVEVVSKTLSSCDRNSSVLIYAAKYPMSQSLLPDCVVRFLSFFRHPFWN